MVEITTEQKETALDKIQKSIDSMDGKYRRIMLMDLAHAPINAIMASVKMKEETVLTVMGSPLYIETKALLYEQMLTADLTVRQRISSEALKSVNMIVTLRDNAQNENVKLGASKDLLDRAGYSPKEKVDPQITIIVQTNIPAPTDTKRETEEDNGEGHTIRLQTSSE